MALVPWQLSIDDLVLGEGTDYRVYEFGSETDMVVRDVQRTQSDGTRFGRDTRNGGSWTIELGIDAGTPEEALNKLDTLKAVWRGDRYRNTPESVGKLYVSRPGRDSMIYGRPRKIAVSSLENVGAGYIPVTLEFAGAEDVYYDALATSTGIVIQPASIGGFEVPAQFPWQAANVAPVAQNRLSIGGSLPTWLVMTLFGPITSPIVEVGDNMIISFPTLTIGPGRYVKIDPRPFSRSIKNDSGGSEAGKISTSSPKMSNMKLSPGDYTVRLKGTDVTGTANVLIECHAAYAGM